MPRADDTDPTRALRQARFRDRKKERTETWRAALLRIVAIKPTSAKAAREMHQIAAEALDVERKE
jgi:hypothetical protein